MPRPSLRSVECWTDEQPTDRRVAPDYRPYRLTVRAASEIALVERTKREYHPGFGLGM
jgi:hypothetical protein